MRRAIWVLTLAVLSSSAFVESQAAPNIHVTRVGGPIPRHTIVRALVASDLRECQHTHMGHPLRFRLTIARNGRATIDRVLAHEEIRSYVPCVRRYVSGLRFAVRAHSTSAQIAVIFQPTMSSSMAD